MVQIAGMIARVLERPDDDALLAEIRGEVENLCRKFPRRGGQQFCSNQRCAHART